MKPRWRECKDGSDTHVWENTDSYFRVWRCTVCGFAVRTAHRESPSKERMDKEDQRMRRLVIE
jgi:rubrerythrin